MVAMFWVFDIPNNGKVWDVYIYIYVFITIYIVVSDGEYCNSMITIDTTIFIITYYIYNGEYNTQYHSGF